MKRLFAAALLALSSIAFGATLNPIQLLNPAGSTTGQVISSTGATTAPHWSTVTLDGVGGFTGIGFLYRNSANSYITVTPPIIQGVGGTGLSTLAAHQLVVGGALNAMTALATGTAGQPLLSGGASADPAYGTLAVAAGGTGATSASAALTSLGAAALAGSATQNFSVKDATTANQAVAFDQVFGVGQTWTDVHGSRVVGTTYTNTTTRPIFIIAAITVGGLGGAPFATLAGTTIFGAQAYAAGVISTMYFVVPAGGTYSVSCSGTGTPSVSGWMELR